MGIPSYFSYIVRTHRKIIKNLHSTDIPKINNLYLDCNSFIYEAYNTIKNEYNNSDLYKNKTEKEYFRLIEVNIIKMACDSLEKIIIKISPDQRVFIAFDGVAPMAKLDQQRNRRYMTAFQNSLANDDDSVKSPHTWNTSSITPGTEFMEKLGSEVRKRFRDSSHLNVKTIMISTSDDPGEGEHKIYKYIRNDAEYHKDTTTIIYGLDADLIMLTLNHLHISEKMYLYRETPEFIKSIDKTLDPKESYLLDIPLFARSIIKELSCERIKNIDDISLQSDILFDYIFICFLLGNDFLPHFPALNIRTNGINNLINAYKYVFEKNTNETLTKNHEIIWKNVRKYIEYLSLNELDFIKEEYSYRDKISKRLEYNNKDENLMLPLKERATELYINPNDSGWEFRYYKSLFNIKNHDERLKEISINYLEGLEWTMKYYSSGCVNWRWQYNYYYPPLLVDLLKYIPYFDHTFVIFKEENPVSPLTQLSYVLPPVSMGLLPNKLRIKLIKEQPDWYDVNYVFIWAFCKFLWEAHVDLPHIDIDLLEQIVNS
jgi:5'-3' exonuclease